MSYEGNASDAHSYGGSLNFHTVAANNLHAAQIMKRHMKNMLKFNSSSEMTKCLLAQLPVISQSYTTTPYLDHTLFSYDEKLISNLERPKPIGDQIIKFNIRESGRLCFRLYPGLQMLPPGGTATQSYFKRLVAFIWHPKEPFCISVQRATQDYNVNFHVYSKLNFSSSIE
jgi:de-etiolated-1